MPGFHPIKHIKEIFGLYDDLICTQLINSSMECMNQSCDKDQVIIDFLGMYDKQKITFFYLVKGYPQYLPLDFKDKIRRNSRGDTRISFFNVLRNHHIDWSGAQMKSKLRTLKMANEEQAGKDVDAFNLFDNLNAMGNMAFVESSLVYLANADVRRGRSLVKTSMMMTISGERGEDFDDTVHSVEEYCRHIGLNMERVYYDIPDVISYFSPFKNIKELGKRGPDTIHTQVLTDELVARFNSYSQGILGTGGKRALYFGTDIYSGFPVLKIVKYDAEAPEIWLCTAETGGGKSFFVKVLILQLLANNMNGTIMDVEGNEYSYLAEFCSRGSKVVVLNMGEGQGKYFDPVEISKPTGITDIDKDAKKMSIDFTNAIFKVLLGRAYQENVWLSSIVNDVVGLTYERFGITDDPDTWVLSEGMTVKDVFDTLRIMHDFTKAKTNKEKILIMNKYHIEMPEYIDNVDYMAAIEQAVAFVSPFFVEGGLRSSLFSERVMVSDIAEADLVVCSFGMAGKAAHAIDEVQMALMQLSAAQISHQRSIFSKAQGKFNFKIWEEFQRWGKFPDSDKTIGVAVTGGRKLGDTNIIITNVVKELLDDDRFGIFSNKTSFMIGSIDDNQVRTELAERLSIPNMKIELDNIASAHKTDDTFKNSSGGSSSIYRFGFLLGLDSSKYGVTKMLIPRDMAKSDLFRTGVKLESDSEEYEVEDDE